MNTFSNIVVNKDPHQNKPPILCTFAVWQNGAPGPDDEAHTRLRHIDMRVL